MTLKRVLLWSFAIFIAGCATPKTSTPAPTPEAIKIYYPASLLPWVDELSTCAATNPLVALYFIQLTSPGTKFGPEDLLLELGQPNRALNGSYLAQVGEEQVVFIINQANPISRLTASQLRQIYSGEVRIWEDSKRQSIQVWVSPQGETTQQIVDNALDLSQQQAPDAMLAPNPLSMLQAVSSDEAAIGYLPLSFLRSKIYAGADQVKIITLEQTLNQELRQPVIISTQSEPSGYGRWLIACLQKVTLP